MEKKKLLHCLLSDYLLSLISYITFGLRPERPYFKQKKNKKTILQNFDQLAFF